MASGGARLIQGMTCLHELCEGVQGSARNHARLVRLLDDVVRNRCASAALAEKHMSYKSRTSAPGRWHPVELA